MFQFHIAFDIGGFVSGWIQAVNAWGTCYRLEDFVRCHKSSSKNLDPRANRTKCERSENDSQQDGNKNTSIERTRRNHTGPLPYNQRVLDREVLQKPSPYDAYTTKNMVPIIRAETARALYFTRCKSTKLLS